MKKIITIIIFIMIYTLTILFFISDKVYYSENEFRYLERINPITFDTIISRKTFSNIDTYIEDHFPLRENFIRLKNSFELLLGKDIINNVHITEDYYIEHYTPLKNKERLLKTLNDFYDNNQGIDINFMLVPTSYQINKERLEKYYQNNAQKEDIEYIYNNLNMNTINVLETLEKHNKKYPMYYQTDHHWTTHGAYFAYKEYVGTKGLKAIDLKLKKVTKDFKGSIYSKVLFDNFTDDIYIYEIKDEIEVTYTTGNEIIKKDTLYNMSYLEEKDKYSLFLDNNNPLLTIDNKDKKLKNNILIIKDSYANSFIPFLTQNYETIHVIDPRYYGLSISEYIKENEIKEVLFLYNINTIDSDTGLYRIK